MTDILEREQDFRAAAEKCQLVRELCDLVLINGRPCPISFATAANEKFDLGLDWVRPGRLGAPRPAQAVPKPVKKAGK